MSHKHHTTKMIVLVGLSSIAIHQDVEASIIENVIDTSGLSEPILISYGDHTINSAISPGVDIDGYSFAGTAGDSLRVVVTGHSGNFDPVIQLRNPFGTVLQTQSCSASTYSTCSINLDQSLLATGLHYVNISDAGNDNAGNYTLHFDNYSPTNNWNGIAYDDPLTNQLGHAGDHDFFAFQGQAATGVQINVTGLSDNLDPHLQVWDPLGTLIFDDLCGASTYSTCSFLADLNLSESGIYKMGLFDADFENTGSYSLNIGCTYGTCPSDAPSAVPLPPAIWLLSSGILGLIGISRAKEPKNLEA